MGHGGADCMAGITANSSSNTEQDQTKRTWFRKLFEAQNAAYSPQKAGQPSIGWYFWSCKSQKTPQSTSAHITNRSTTGQTEYDIDAWSYRRGLADGYIPSNISDPSTYAFPVLDNGCIDDTFSYVAAVSVSGLGPSSTGSSGSSSATSTGGSSAATTTGSSSSSSSASSSSSTAKSSAPAGMTIPGGLWVSALGVTSVLLFCLS